MQQNKDAMNHEYNCLHAIQAIIPTTVNTIKDKTMFPVSTLFKANLCCAKPGTMKEGTANWGIKWLPADL